MKRPIQVHKNIERKTSLLYFPEKEGERQIWNEEIPETVDVGEYYMRGGIAWPAVYKQTDEGIQKIMGYAVLCGMNVQSKEISVFEQTEFTTIENVVNDGAPYEDKNGKKIGSGAVIYFGLAGWLNRCWSRYYADHYYWNQNPVQFKQYLLQVVRSPMIKNNALHFVNIEMNPEDAIQSIWLNLKSKKLVQIEKGSILLEELGKAKKGDYRQIHPAVHALSCAIAGMERSPWREPRREFDVW